MKKMGSKMGKAICAFATVATVCAAMPTIDAQAASNDELTAVSKIFDATYYATLYPDVAASVNGSQLGLLNHYVYFGVNEGRNASATFNATDYMNKNPDLQALYGDYMLGYVFHYANAGKAEGRDGIPVAGSEIQVPENYTLLGIYSTEYNAEQDRACRRRHRIPVDHPLQPGKPARGRVICFSSRYFIT